MAKITSLAGEWGLEYCNDCPFLAFNKNKKKFECCPNNYFFNKIDEDELGRYKVPEWCGNNKNNV